MDREEAGFKVMGEYIRRRHKMATQFIATRLILDLCEETERTPGDRVGMRCWEQDDIDLKGRREMAEEAADADKDGRGK